MYPSSLRLYVCLSSVFMCCVYMICAECNLICVLDAEALADFHSSLTCAVINLCL